MGAGMRNVVILVAISVLVGCSIGTEIANLDVRDTSLGGDSDFDLDGDGELSPDEVNEKMHDLRTSLCMHKDAAACRSIFVHTKGRSQVVHFLVDFVWRQLTIPIQVEI